MLKLDKVSKRFGPITVVDALELEIREGEFFTLLGPSGCGKTTTLRCIAGLERPDGGSIYLRDRCLVDSARRLFVQPERRSMGMVFQSYALWPHMTVFENVAYPLRLRRVGREEVARKVDEVLTLVGLEGYADRQAPMLSGGQQQRVALARALVFSPQVLLLDEPLSNLDALLRDEMRRQLRGLRDRLGITTIFVTHDQVEALSLSDRIAIMHSGRVEQVGAPREVYGAPSTQFAQAFLGKTFSVQATVVAVRRDGLDVLPRGTSGSDKHMAVPLPIPLNGDNVRLDAGQAVRLTVRPEQIKVWASRPPGIANVVDARVRSALFTGDRHEYVVELGDAAQVLPVPSSQVHAVGHTIYLELPEGTVRVWPA